MAIESLPYPTVELNAKALITSLGVNETIFVGTGDGVRRITKGNIGFARIYLASSAPSGTRTTNDIWVDTSSSELNVWNGSSWVSFPLGIPASGVDLSDIEDIAADRILGRISTSGTIQTLTPTQIRTLLNIEDGANNYTHPNHSGHVLSSGDGATTIQNGVVANAMLTPAGSNTIKGNPTGSSGEVQDIAFSQNTFPARAGTGTLEAKPISDDALTLLSLDLADMKDFLGIEEPE